MNDIRPLHYYLFSFQYHYPKKGASGAGSVVVGYRFKNKITMPVIEENKAAALPGIPSECIVLIAVSYLGQMHKTEMEKGTQ